MTFFPPLRAVRQPHPSADDACLPACLSMSSELKALSLTRKRTRQRLPFWILIVGICAFKRNALQCHPPSIDVIYGTEPALCLCTACSPPSFISGRIFGRKFWGSKIFMFESRGRRNLSHLRARCAQLDHLLPFDRAYDMFCQCRFLPFLCEESSTCTFIIVSN